MATLTLRNVPDDLVARLKARAKRHRRSLNNETIAALELADAAASGAGPAAAVAPAADQEAALARIREIQARFPGARNAEPDQRTPEQIEAELHHFATLRSQFKGPPQTSEQFIAAIERDSHPRDLEPLDPGLRRAP